MHYYQFNIADYRKKTGHLTLVEHAIYRALIDTYYLEESPLSADKAKLMRSHNVRSAEEKEAFEGVLSDFFTLESDGYHHEKCDQTLFKIYAKSEKARLSAQKRWEKKANAMRTHKSSNANAMQSDSEGNANGMLPINPDTQIPNNPSLKDTCESKIPLCPHEKIINLYHEILPELPKIVMSTWSGSQREKDLRSRWNQHKEHQSLDYWNWFFKVVKGSSFHIGENDRGWRADLGWLVKRSNFDKMVQRGMNQ